MRYAPREAEIGHMQIKISGCINACGHHHVGHVGILGLDKAGVENYQILWAVVLGVIWQLVKRWAVGSMLMS